MRSTDPTDLFEIVRDLAKVSTDLRPDGEDWEKLVALVERAREAMTGSIEVRVEYRVKVPGQDAKITESLTEVWTAIKDHPVSVVEQRRHYRSKWLPVKGDVVVDVELDDQES